MSDRLTREEINTIIDAAGTGAIGVIFSPGFDALVDEAFKQRGEARDRAVRDMEACIEEREKTVVECPCCGSRLRLVEETDHDN